MFTTPNVHSVASSAMAAAFRNAAQPLGPVQPVPGPSAAVRRVVVAWTALLAVVARRR